MDLDAVTPYLGSLILGVVASYITVRISITELKKDKAYLTERLDKEIQDKKESLEAIKAEFKDAFEEVRRNNKEYRDDVRSIYNSLNKIQVSQARYMGREDMLEGFKEAIQSLKEKG